MNKDIHISIDGGCVLRDTFRIHYSDPDGKNYIVDRYIRCINPISGLEQTPVLDPAENIDEPEIFGSISNFFKRTFTLELKRNIYDFLFETNSDYLLLDTVQYKYDLINIIKDGKSCKITEGMEWYCDVIDKLKAKSYIDIDEYSVIRSDEELISMLDEAIPKYVEKVLQHYPKDKVILFEILPSDYYYSAKEEKIKSFTQDSTDQCVKRIGHCFNKLRNLFNGCHVIEFPDNVIADEEHEWGLSRFHFTVELYDYLYKAVNLIICEDNTKAEEERKLKDLKAEYSDIYYKKYNKYFVNSLNDIDSNQSMLTYTQLYCKYLKDIIINPDYLSNISNYFKENNYSSCALYGFNPITEVYVEILKRLGIKTDYIIFDSNQSDWFGIPIIKPKEEVYPNTDLIVVCHASNPEAHYRNLSHRNIPFTDIYKIIK